MKFYLKSAILLAIHLFARQTASLVCYDASIVLRDASAAVPGPISSTSLENNCKVCLSLVVTQELGDGVDANFYPIKMTRRTCGTEEGMSCAKGRYSCPPADGSTFERPKFILNNEPVPVQISPNAEKQCQCCDTDFCNGQVPEKPIPCNVTQKVSADEMAKCVGCMVERRMTWDGRFSEVTKCLSTGCESYQDSCSSCDANEYERCSCSCSINYPKIGYFNTSFVVPNKRQTLTVSSGIESKSGYDVQDAQARLVNVACSHFGHAWNGLYSMIVIVACLFSCF